MKGGCFFPSIKFTPTWLNVLQRMYINMRENMVADGKNELKGSLYVFQLTIVMILTIAMMMVVVGRGRWL